MLGAVSLRAPLLVVLVAVAVPRGAAAQPSPFSPAPDTNPQAATPPPPKAPAVPAPPPGSPDTTTSASPPVAAAGRPPPTRSTSGKAPTVGPADAGAPPEPEPAAPGDPHLALGAGGHVAFGTAPAVSLGLRLSAEIATGGWSLGLEGRYDLPASAHTTQGATARSSLAGAAFVPCVRAQGTWACAVVLVARVESSAGGQANAPVVRDEALFLGVGGRLAIHAPLPLDFALRITAEVLGHPVPYELKANDRRIFKSSVVSTLIGPALVRAF
jgi:hypothetical protein